MDSKTNLTVVKNDNNDLKLIFGAVPESSRDDTVVVNVTVPTEKRGSIIDAISNKFTIDVDNFIDLEHSSEDSLKLLLESFAVDDDDVSTAESNHQPTAESKDRKILYTVSKNTKPDPYNRHVPMKVSLRELDFNMIRPNLETMNTNIGGSKVTVIGKPGSGKSVLIKALLHSKRHIIPTGVVISGSEDTNHFYKDIFPACFIHESYNKSIIEKIHKRQKLAKEHLANPWAAFVMDDCMDDVKIFNDPIMIGLMKNSRHWSLFTIISTQYCLDFKPVIRTNMDGVFIFRDASVSNREKLYRNFASIIPTYNLFTQILDAITEDYTCLYIHNLSVSNNWQECCFYIKAPLLDTVKFGCKEFWTYSDTRTK